MKEKLFEDIKLAAYFLWEYSHSNDNDDNALKLWYCAEDLACFFQRSGIYTKYHIQSILDKGIYHLHYIEFVRNIAFRIFWFTGNDDRNSNWYVAEQVLQNEEWRKAIIDASNIYNNINKEKNIIKSIMSKNVRKYYEK